MAAGQGGICLTKATVADIMSHGNVNFVFNVNCVSNVNFVSIVKWI